MKGNFTSALLGGAVVAILTTATSALAGSGIGGVFNLGQSNSVNATTTLSGATNAEQLSVTNTSTGASAAGIRIQAAAGKPPIVVAGTTARATNLNADLLDGLTATQFARVAYSETHGVSWFESGRATLRSVTLTAPQKGFVIVIGAALANGEDCGSCILHLRFRIDGNDWSTMGASLDVVDEYWVPLSNSVTVPVLKGTHTYELIGSWLANAAPTWFETSLTALFVPFNANGGQDPLPAAASGADGPASAAEAPAAGPQPQGAEESPAESPADAQVEGG